jgi:glutathione S-transferase
VTLVLYDNADSTNALKVRLALAELGLAHATVALPLHGPKPADHASIHPFGLLPALVDGDLALTESNTILRYLAEREGRADLRGADPAARARVDGLLDTLSLELRPRLWAAEEVVVYALDVDAGERAVRTASLAAGLDAFDTLLDADGPHALGALTIADWALAGRLLHLERLGLPAATAPRLRRALAATRARPAFTQAR